MDKEESGDKPTVVILFGKYKDEDTEVIGVYSDVEGAAEGVRKGLDFLSSTLNLPGFDPKVARDLIVKGLPYETLGGKAKYWTERFMVE